jgi:hypothetical protein
MQLTSRTDDFNLNRGTFEQPVQLRHEVVIFRASIRQRLKYKKDVKIQISHQRVKTCGVNSVIFSPIMG